jgi:beta-N-acetylhexosaminidase
VTLSATILDCDGPELSRDEAAFFREARPWGFTLFARNIDTPDQVQRLCDALRMAAGHDAPIFVDQEGGRVQRLRAPHWREYLPALDQADRAGERAHASFHLRGRLIAAELRAVGIDGNYAPCADLAWPDTHPFLRNRCAGHSPHSVTRNARAFAEGLMQGGVLPVVKHLPGHGRARADSHQETPLIDLPRAELEQTDFLPFKALADLPLAMTAHVRLPFFGDAPATSNPAALAMIRDDWGFAGALMTDDIGMKALTGPFRTRAAEARAASCDLVLFCNEPLSDRAAVVEGAGLLEGAALARAQAALDRRSAPEIVDIQALEADLGALLSGAAHV